MLGRPISLIPRKHHWWKVQRVKKVIGTGGIFINVKPNIFLNDFVAVNVGNVFLHKPPQYTADLISHEITRSYQYFIFMKAGTERPVSKLFSITNVNSKILIFSISTLTVYLRGMPI